MGVDRAADLIRAGAVNATLYDSPSTAALGYRPTLYAPLVAYLSRELVGYDCYSKQGHGFILALIVAITS